MKDLTIRFLAALFFVHPLPLVAQIEEGNVGKYFTVDEKTGVKPGAYPQLSLDELRKITLYSKLSIRGSRVSIADDKYMRTIESHPRDREVLAVTSDRFRFTVLKSCLVNPKELNSRERALFRFLWIKHATREKAPDGRPWLKDLVLLPYSKKTGKLAGPWPFAIPSGRSIGYDWPLFITAVDPRPRWEKFPPPEKCVVGTFKSGSSDYLVLDVFGGYSWWGKVTYSEFFTLRGKDANAVAAFHEAGRKARAKAPWTMGQWRSPTTKTLHQVLGSDRAAVQQLSKALPDLMATSVRSEKSKGWEDLLRLEMEKRPVKAIDDQIKGFKTLGELVAWAKAYAERNAKGSRYAEWFEPLEEILKKPREGYLVTARVLRYAFRRMGFPARIQCIPRPQTKQELYPRFGVHVYVPSRDVSVVLFPFEYVVVFKPEKAVFWGLPNVTATRGGKLPIFDAYLGGGSFRIAPLPGGKSW